MNAVLCRLLGIPAGAWAAALLLAVQPLSAEDAIKTEKADWSVAAAVFDVDRSDGTLLSLASLLPRLVREDLSGIGIHRLPPEERTELARMALQAKEVEYLSAAAKHHEDRDSLFFNPNAAQSQFTDAEKRIAETDASLEALRATSPAQVVVPEELPVKFMDSDSGELWNLDGTAPGTLRKQRKMDLLITGDIVQVGDYFGVGAYAWTSGGRVVLWEGAGGHGDMVDIAERIAAAARGIVLGRSWASLSVTVNPSRAVISVNGESMGVGQWTDRNLKPGPASVEITSDGYIPKVLDLTLAAGETQAIEVELEAAETKQVLVRSIPTGATVRLGTLWLGLTPLPVTLPDRVMPLSIEKEGFRKRVLPFAPDTERLTVPLETVLVDPAEELEVSRKRLYNAITWFTFSIAPTLILIGVSKNYAQMKEASTNAQDLQTYGTGQVITSAAMAGSIALNAGLLTVVLVRLSRYLKAAEELSGS